MENTRKEIPTVVINGTSVFPGMIFHLNVNGKSAIAAQAAMEDGEPLFLLTQRGNSGKMANMKGADKVEDKANDKVAPKATDSVQKENQGNAGKETEPEKVSMEEKFYHVGTLCTVRKLDHMPREMVRVVITGECRGVLHEIQEEGPYVRALVEPVLEEEDPVQNEVQKEAMGRYLKELFLQYSEKNKKVPREAVERISQTTHLRVLVDMIAGAMQISYLEQQEILGQLDFTERYSKMTALLLSEIQVTEVKQMLQQKVRERVNKNQRDYYLREEMKQIRHELGEDTTVSDGDEFLRQLEELAAPEEVKTKLRKEITRFKSAMGSPAEMGVLRTYIETLLEMPWEKRAEEQNDLGYASSVLEKEHYGLQDVKERVLEFLAVRMLTEKGESPILCLVGPPGTGKTSIAKSLAKALNKPYVRISLGGIRDEAEIRGHRKTYVGAMPGRIANGIHMAGVKNPLMLLDEIDKVSTDYRGDTFSALLEVLDSEQNYRFRDHYLEVPLDLSEVTFVATANTLQTIPRPLLDRMEIIEVSSYTENEKLHIAEEHLIPKQLARHGLDKSTLDFRQDAVEKLIRGYTREAGVRQLEREIGNVCRKFAKEMLTAGKKTEVITKDNLEQYLGKEKYTFQSINDEDEVGVVRGLAWTNVGGDTLQIEVNVMPGKGEIQLTGQMGDVMKESARTAISYIRSVGETHGIEKDFFEDHDIHIHIPEGAVPKDGPSAGITMATAILSAVTGRKVRSDLAMTGEITLRGRVLPVGGLKEKLLAAKKAGVQMVLLPKKCMPTVEELSEEVTKELELIPVETMEEVEQRAFR